VSISVRLGVCKFALVRCWPNLFIIFLQNYFVFPDKLYYELFIFCSLKKFNTFNSEQSIWQCAMLKHAMSVFHGTFNVKMNLLCFVWYSSWSITFCFNDYLHVRAYNHLQKIVPNTNWSLLISIVAYILLKGDDFCVKVLFVQVATLACLILILFYLCWVFPA